MEENFLYMPPTCKNCNKLNPEHILIKYNDYITTFDNYSKINKKINSSILSEISGNSEYKPNNNLPYPLKLFIKNGYYR